ncbi:LppX_LprAFG lipoprotein [Kineococcus gypseus]|uniref:LppX_LprAFG lipoprotein n=1 Tax=Kineococcus gypseus TaxID=1637102 RepID=UPI003D7E294E
MHTTARTTRTPRRRLVLLAGSGAAALALGLGACGADEQAAAPAATTQLSAYEVVQASAETSTTAGSAKFSFSVEGTAPGEQAVTVTGDGAFDSADEAVRVQVALPAATGAAGGGGSVELRVVDDVAYASGSPLTGRGQWVRLPLDAAAVGVDAGTLDPARQLEQLRAVAGDVQEVPGTTVRGVETRGYRGSVDLAEALEQLPPEQRTPDAERAAAEVGSVPFTLYVDDENRPARLTVDVAGPEGVQATVSMDYYDWGSDVDVAAPDPATVTELPLGETPQAPAPAGTPATAGA